MNINNRAKEYNKWTEKFSRRTQQQTWIVKTKNYKVYRSIEHMQAKEQREKRKNGSGGNISQLILWGQCYSHTETRWRHPNNRKLQTNISCDYGCKNPQKLYETKPNSI